MNSIRIGLRNLARNRWRSGLTLGGVAVSVAFMVWILGFMEGWLAEMVRGATAVDVGQVQIHSAAFARQPRIYHTFPLDEELLHSVEAVDGVEAATPRLRVYGLVGHEEKSQVTQIIGVDPEREVRATPLVEGLSKGRWLSTDPPPFPAPREVVLGEGVARQLRVGVGDELVVFFEAADGSLGNDLLHVVGVVRTGNTAVDRNNAYMHVRDLQYLAALDGEVHEILLRTHDLTRARSTAAAVAAALGARAGQAAVDEAAPDELVVRPWQDILPSVEKILALSRQSYAVTYLLIYLVAAVGILNTQRMSALERRREFGVLMAIGMRPRRIFRMVLTESVVMGVLGGLVGTGLGSAVTWFHAVRGLDLGLFTDRGGFSYMGVSFTGRIHAVLTPTAAIQPIVVMVVVALLAGLWPAFRSARLDPAPTIAGRT